MAATLHCITDRHRAHGAEVTALSQFTLGPGEPMDADDLVRAPGWSLYALDVDEGAAVFTELPGNPDLTASGFVYQTQFEEATRLATLPFDEFEALAARLPRPEALVFLFSTGRAGSTLASRILGQVPGVRSFSEPDAFTNLALARFRLDEDRISRLIGAAARVVAQTEPGTPPGIVAIKPRSEATLQIPLYARTLPQARYPFLYRDGIGYADSAFRFAQRLVGPENFGKDPDSWKTYWPILAIGAPESMLDDWFGADRANFGDFELFALSWVLRMEGALAAIAEGLPLVPIHYDDLNRDRPAQTLALLEACGIDASHLPAALRAFERDAQEGTVGAHIRTARPLNDAERARVVSVLDRWDLDPYSDARLPGPV